MNIEQRWDVAIVRAKDLLVKYKKLDNDKTTKYTYYSAIDYLTSYLYLADVWKKQSISVLELLEEIDYDIEKWRDKIPFGPNRGKMGREFR